MRFLLLLCLALPAGSDVQQRIIGGSDASISSYPHQLSLRNYGKHFCGASLISPNRAVTTAGCVAEGIDTYTILGGSTSYTDTTCATCVLRDVTFISTHPAFNYTTSGYHNDIAVIGFDPVTFNENLQVIVLSNPTHGDFAGDVCTFTGWGRTALDSNYSVVLQQSQATVMTNADCDAAWGVTWDINDGQICISDLDSTVCYGDLGGPLECNGILAGALSFYNGYCDLTFPPAYTRISHFYSWIIAQ